MIFDEPSADRGGGGVRVRPLLAAAAEENAPPAAALEYPPPCRCCWGARDERPPLPTSWNDMMMIIAPREERGYLGGDLDIVKVWEKK